MSKKNSESVAILDFDEALDASTENESKENTTTLAEVADSEPVEEISVPNTASEVEFWRKIWRSFATTPSRKIFSAKML